MSLTYEIGGIDEVNMSIVSSIMDPEFAYGNDHSRGICKLWMPTRMILFSKMRLLREMDAL